ncbi:MAG: isoaspartyl peptidase/L-asparaginase [Deltaproteobacteria bacterium]|nr:MAG: isoaspartyl peptidase/L-asparaginase [Deltaproteobacteria bacterium]
MALALALHGGAGLIRRDSLSSEREQAARIALAQALDAGWKVLTKGGSALGAVEAAVVVLEDAPCFNAGRGSVLTQGGGIELDASIMDGRDRSAGAVAGCSLPRNPIRAALAVRDRSPHVLLCGPGADAFVQEVGLDQAALSWFLTPERQTQYARVAERGGVSLDHDASSRDVFGTVGAVACDRHGDLAAGTSTGGMVNKRRGRVGDSPILGAGTYAWNSTCAVSGTGHGEPFMRLGVALRVSMLMELRDLNLACAAHQVIHTDLPDVHGQGGLIAVDAQGNVTMPFNTGGMFRAFRTATDEGVEIW